MPRRTPSESSSSSNHHAPFFRLPRTLPIITLVVMAYLAQVQLFGLFGDSTRKNTGEKTVSNPFVMPTRAATLPIQRQGLPMPSYQFVWEDSDESTATADKYASDPSADDGVSRASEGDDEPKASGRANTKEGERPLIAWLASYPNSGTSYTMTMVERSTKLSTATNYGLEIAFNKDDSIPVHDMHPEGPFWEGLSGKRGTTVRALPSTYVMTKTHCGGRCLNCPATEYFVANATAFLQACQRTSGYATLQGKSKIHFQDRIDASRIARVIHLIRNPFHNVVARFHLERRHFILEQPSLGTRYPNNATGFQRWCKYMDQKYGPEEAKVLPAEIVDLMSRVPCRAEFFKYVQWHSRLIEIMSSPRLLLNSRKEPDRVLVVHYEDYETKLDATVDRIMEFLQQQVVLPLRPFRPLPTYADHYSKKDRAAAKELAQSVATTRTWKLIQHYFE